MPRVKKETANKRKTTNKKVATTPSLRASAKQSSSDKTPTKIATLRQAQGKLPRNDKKGAIRVVALSIPVYSLTGRATGQMSLPKEIFGVKPNKQLLSQAIRVYSTNQKQLLAKTKTRGEIKASKVKIYRQKGTGKARHGAISAPIFVGGGIAFGPQVRKVRLNLPTRMKKAALLSALSFKLSDKNIFGLTGVDKATGKTKEISQLLLKIYGGKKIKSTLIITEKREENILRSVSNLEKVSALSADLLNAYEILKHEMLFITKEAVDVLSRKGKAERVKSI